MGTIYGKNNTEYLTIVNQKVTDYGQNSTIYVQYYGIIDLYGTGATIKTNTNQSLTVNVNYASSGNVVEITKGNVTINGYDESNIRVKLTGTTTVFNTSKSGNNVVFNLGSAGSITIPDGAGKSINIINVDNSVTSYNVGEVKTNSTAGATFTGTTGDDTLTNSGDRVNIYGSGGSDRISNTGNNVTITSGDGSDYIDNNGDNVLIMSGIGNDTIHNLGFNNTIQMTTSGHTSFEGGSVSITAAANFGTTVKGSSGSDKIRLYASSNNTEGVVAEVRPGKGHDTLTGSSGEDVYTFGTNDDYNVITNYQSKDIIKFYEGSITSTLVSGNDLIIGNGKTTIRLMDVGRSVQVQNTDGTITKLKVTGTKYTTTVGFNRQVTINSSDPPVETIGNADDESNDYYDVRKSNFSLDSGGGNDQILTATTASKITIYSGTGNDTILNHARYSFVDTGDDDDYIDNGGALSTLYTGDGDDVINNISYYVSINGGDGDDVIVNTGGSSDIVGGKGDDDVTLGSGDNYQYADGDGNDVVYNYSSNDTLRITSGSIDSSQVSGNDVILKIGTGSITLKNAKSQTLNIVDGSGKQITTGNSSSDSPSSGGGSSDTSTGGGTDTTPSGGGSTDTASSGTGEDILNNNVNDTVINGTRGDDTISNTNSSGATIYGGNGNDFINSAFETSKTLIYGGFGNDSIYNDGENSTLSGDSGNDYIRNSKANVSISGGEGNDSIITGTENVTINGGAGNDLITLYSSSYNNVIEYAAGDGDDVVYSYLSSDTIKITEGEYSTQVSGNDVIINVQSGSITLKDSKDKTINIIAEKSDTTTGGGDDTTGGGSDDTTAGGGDDTLANSITGTDKAESLVGTAEDDTITGLKGNDTLTGSGGNDLFVYTDGDGKDVITDFKTGDAIELTDAEISKVSTSGNNVVLKIGSGTITLKDAKDESIIVNHSDGLTSTIQGGGKVNVIANDIRGMAIAGGVLNDSITNYYGASSVEIDGGAANDTIANYALDVIVNGDAGNDNISNSGGNATINGGAGNDTIFLNDSIYSTVMGGIGNDSIVVGESSYNTIDGGAGNDTIKLDANSSNNIIQYVNGGGKDVITDYAEGTAAIQIIGGTISKIANGTRTNKNDIIFTVGRGSITVKDGAGKAITFMDEEGNTTTQTYGNSTMTLTDSFGDTVDISDDTTVIEVDGSTRTKAVEIIGNSKDNILDGGSGNVLLTGGKGKDEFVYRGGNDIITDYTAGQDIIRLVGKTYSTATYVGESGTDLVLSFVEGGSLTLENIIPVKSKSGVMTKQAPQKVTIIDKDGINIGAQVYGADYASTIDVVNADGDSIVANPAVDYINAKKRSKVVTLIGNSKDNTIVGGSKADTINGFSGNNVLTGNGGKDMFIINAANGSDTITDYVAKQDSITAAANYSNYVIDGKDVIFSFDGTDNTLTVVNGKDKVINFNGVDKTFNDIHEFVLQPESKDSNTKYDFTTSEHSEVITIDASKRKKSVEIIANSNGNSIVSGKGADSITLGNGADTLVYTSGSGNDTIKNYAEDDTILLGKNTSITRAQLKEVTNEDGTTVKNYTFTIGKNKVTVEDVAGKTITFMDSDNNRIRYDVPDTSRAYIEVDIFADDNFGSDGLSSILDNNSNVISNDYDFDSASNYINKQSIEALAGSSIKRQNK